MERTLPFHSQQLAAADAADAGAAIQPGSLPSASSPSPSSSLVRHYHRVHLGELQGRRGVFVVLLQAREFECQAVIRKGMIK